MTVAEFLDWPGDDSFRRFELVEGEPRARIPHALRAGSNKLKSGGCPEITLSGLILSALANRVLNRGDRRMIATAGRGSS
jgi:hypothetical protein